MNHRMHNVLQCTAADKIMPATPMLLAPIRLIVADRLPARCSPASPRLRNCLPGVFPRCGDWSPSAISDCGTHILPVSEFFLLQRHSDCAGKIQRNESTPGCICTHEPISAKTLAAGQASVAAVPLESRSPAATRPSHANCESQNTATLRLQGVAVPPDTDLRRIALPQLLPSSSTLRIMCKKNAGKVFPAPVHNHKSPLRSELDIDLI